MTTAVAKPQTALQLFEEFTDTAKYNILRPSETVMTAQSPFHTVYANVIRFEVKEDTYEIEGKQALNRRALDKIASAAGISFVHIQRTDNGTDPDITEVTVIAQMRRADGSIITQTGKKLVDAKKLPGRQSLDKKRQFRLERAETGAKNRAIKALMALKSSYTTQELNKPFVVPQITVNYDEIIKDPELRRLAGAQALGAMHQLYPQQNSTGHLPAEQPNAGQLSAGTSSPAKELPAAAAPPQEDPPPPTDELPELPFDKEQSEAKANEATLRRLFNERVHNYSDAVLDKMLAEPPEKIVQYIDLFTEYKKKPQSSPQQGGNGKKVLTEKQIKRLFAIAYNNGYDNDSVHDLISELFNGITSIDDLTKEQYNYLCGDEKTGVSSYLEGHPAGGGA